jgi:hypothetical protein
MFGAQRLVGIVIEASEEFYWSVYSTVWSNFEAVLAVKEFRTSSYWYAAIPNTSLCEDPHFIKQTSQSRGYAYKKLDSTLRRL